MRLGPVNKVWIRFQGTWKAIETFWTQKYRDGTFIWLAILTIILKPDWKETKPKGLRPIRRLLNYYKRETMASRTKVTAVAVGRHGEFGYFEGKVNRIAQTIGYRVWDKERCSIWLQGIQRIRLPFTEVGFERHWEKVEVETKSSFEEQTLGAAVQLPKQSPVWILTPELAAQLSANEHLGRQQWWLKYLSHYHSCGRPRSNSGLLASAFLSSDSCRHFCSSWMQEVKIPRRQLHRSDIHSELQMGIWDSCK